MRMRNALLVYPQVPPNTYWSFSHTLKLINKKSAMPPLGLITLAALFPEDYRLKLVDMNIEPLTDGHLLWADTVFISAMLIQKASFEAVVARCNRLGVPVVAGGPYATSGHRRIQGVRHFVLGEAETIFPSFLDAFERGCAETVYRAPDRPDLAKAVLPRFDLLKMKAYANMSSQYSRGCPFRCEFCDIWPVYGNKTRVKTATRIMAEFEKLYELGWRGSVFIVDDNFIGNKRRVKAELLPALQTWQQARGYPFQLFTEASIDLAGDEKLMSAMREAGFNEVFIGIESPEADVLREAGKNQNLKVDLLAAVHAIQRQGMEVNAGFILGFDHDSQEVFDHQVSFIQNAAIPKAMVGLLTALPGTRLYQRLATEGRILDDGCGNNTHLLRTNFMTRMDPSVLLAGYRQVLEQIYDKRLKNYFKRCNAFLDTLENRTAFRRKVGPNEILILIRSLIRQSLKPYGLTYIQFIIRNIFKNRRLFPEVIRLALQGHHFYAITRQALR